MYLNPDIYEVRMDTESQVAGQGPGCGGPGHQGYRGILVEGETNHNGRINYILDRKGGKGRFVKIKNK